MNKKQILEVLNELHNSIVEDNVTDTDVIFLENVIYYIENYLIEKYN